MFVSCDVFSVLQTTLSKQRGGEEKEGLGSACHKAAGCAGEQAPIAGCRELKVALAGNEVAKWIPYNERNLLSSLREVNHLVLLLVFSDGWLHLPFAVSNTWKIAPKDTQSFGVQRGP